MNQDEIAVEIRVANEEASMKRPDYHPGSRFVGASYRLGDMWHLVTFWLPQVLLEDPDFDLGAYARGIIEGVIASNEKGKGAHAEG